MFAITFDFDTKKLEQHYHNTSWRNAYMDIETFLAEYGFNRQQGSVYFGDDEVDAVTCVTAAQDLRDAFKWFEPSVRDIRMLRIEDNNDLMPAIKKNLRRNRRGRMNIRVAS